MLFRSDEAIRSAVELAAKYISDRKLPDKAIDVLDETGAAQMLLPASKRKKSIGVRDIEALAGLIGDKAFLFGDTPHSADATVFAFLAAIMSPIAETAMRDAALATPTLVAYRARMMRRFFPDYADAV